jgi:hypothetical protein
MNIDSAPISETTDFPVVILQKDQRIAVLEGENFLLKEQLAWFKKQIFGQKSERIVADLDNQPLLPEIAVADSQAKEPEKEKICYERIKRPRNSGGDTISFPDDLPVKRVELDIPESEKFCPESGAPLVCIGHESVVSWAALPSSFLSSNMCDQSMPRKLIPNTGFFLQHFPMQLFRAVRLMKAFCPTS